MEEDNDMEQMFFLGFCPCCGTGPLGVRICGACDTALAMCDECDAIWMEPTCGAEPIYPEQPDAPCPRCGRSLLDAGAHWATKHELQRRGWADLIVGQGSPLPSAPPKGGLDDDDPDASETPDAGSAPPSS